MLSKDEDCDCRLDGSEVSWSKGTLYLLTVVDPDGDSSLTSTVVERDGESSLILLTPMPALCEIEESERCDDIVTVAPAAQKEINSEKRGRRRL